MLRDPEQIIQLVLIVSVFGLVLAAWIFGVMLWASRRSSRTEKIEQRLGLDDHPDGAHRVLHLWRDGTEQTTSVPIAHQSRGWFGRLDDEARRAGWKMSGITILLTLLIAMIASSSMIYVLTSNPALAVGVAVATFFVFRIYQKHRISGRDALFERQFAEALELAARSLRAGHPLMGAFHLVAEEMSAPVCHVFADICQQHALGADLEDVLQRTGERAVSTDLKLFATSVAIQMRSGGNLASLMDRLAAVIRDRIRLSRRVRVLTAQTQMSKRVLIVLPFIVFMLFSVLNPDYMSVFYQTTPGKLMLAAGAVLLASGAWVMNKMAVLRY